MNGEWETIIFRDFLWSGCSVSALCAVLIMHTSQCAAHAGGGMEVL